MDDASPDLSGHNPFQLIAYLLFKVRHSLEDEEEAGRAPRWVRISRARATQGDSDYIGKGVKAGIDGFAEVLSHMLELSLDIKELLVQTDAGKALVEVTADLLIAATSEEFQNGVRSLVGQPTGGDALGGTSDVITQIKGYMDYIPEPDDVDGMGHELYRLLNIEQLNIPLKADGTVDDSEISTETTEHIVVDNTGKIRLMQWAFGNDTSVHGLGTKENPESDEAKISRFASRRLWEAEASAMPSSTLVTWTGQASPETMAEFFFDDARESEEEQRTIDFTEVHNLLEKLGYVHDPVITDLQKKKFSDKLTKLLRNFQQVNEIPMSGLLDNMTINRLMHLDFFGKNILRAKPFDPARVTSAVDDLTVKDGCLSLVNPDADHWQDEGLELKRDRPGYAYYIAGREPTGTGPVVGAPETGGWISDNTDGATPGFVAMTSRVLRSNTDSNSGLYFHGGIYSEGEALSSHMFFAARHTEPWLEGRSGTPDASTALFSDAKDSDGKIIKPIYGDIHRMYQWIDLSDLQNRIQAAGADNYELQLQASVQIRSLWSDRNNETKLSDQGLVAIELYKSDVFSGDLWVQRENNKRVSRKQSLLMPIRGQMVDPENPLPEIKRKRLWTLCTTGAIQVPTDVTGALIVLEGFHQSAWDTDAYFDDARVIYNICEKK